MALVSPIYNEKHFKKIKPHGRQTWAWNEKHAKATDDNTLAEYAYTWGVNEDGRVKGPRG